MRSATLIAIAIGLLTACEAPVAPWPDAPAFKTTASEPRLGGVAVHPGMEPESEPLASTCGGVVTSSYGINFGKSGCLIVKMTGTTLELTDDVILGATVKGGRITSYQLRAQDVAGKDGIKHESDVIVLQTPVLPSSGGFTVHLHADRVPVYSLSGHLKGRRTGIVGYISIGDIIYQPAP
jgi:hypothetical protein